MTVCDYSSVIHTMNGTIPLVTLTLSPNLRVTQNFPCVPPKFPVFSMSGKVNMQIPRAVATRLL